MGRVSVPATLFTKVEKNKSTFSPNAHPWTGIADGGKLGRAYRAPLAERPRVSVGGKSGFVFLHFRE